MTTLIMVTFFKRWFARNRTHRSLKNEQETLRRWAKRASQSKQY
ncbi:MAG: hypothetical protein ACRCYY_09235 [Trueperaceae bacterium]